MEDTVFQEKRLRDKRPKGRQIFLEYLSRNGLHNFPFCMKNKKYSMIAAFKNCSLFQIKEDIERKIEDQVILRSTAKLGRYWHKKETNWTGNGKSLCALALREKSRKLSSVERQIWLFWTNHT